MRLDRTALKKITIIKVLVIVLLIIVPIVFFYFFIGPEFEISITQTWGNVTYETTEIKTLVAVNNPTPFSRLLKKIEFDLYINDLKIASETSEKSVEIKPLGRTEVWLTSFLNNSKIPDLWVTYLDRGDLFEVRLDGNVTFNSVVREMILPISYETSVHTDLLELLNINEPEGIRVGPATLTLKSLTWLWGEVSTVETEINSVISIYNPSTYPIKITKVNCTIEMNGINVVENATQRTINLIENTGDNTTFTWVLNNAMLNEWWSTHLVNDQITRVIFKLQATAVVMGTEYNFVMAERGEEVSIRILGGTIGFGYRLPIF